MNPLTSEWVEKAEGDFATTARESLAVARHVRSLARLRLGLKP